MVTLFYGCIQKQHQGEPLKNRKSRAQHRDFMKLYGISYSGNVAPIIALFKENGIEYNFVPVHLHTANDAGMQEVTKINPMHTVPTLDDYGFKLYVASSHSLISIDTSETLDLKTIVRSSEEF